MEQGTETTATRPPLPAWPAPPPPRVRHRVRPRTAIVVAIALVGCTLAAGTYEQQRAIDRLNTDVARAHAAADALADRVDGLGTDQSQLTAQVDGILDPTAIVADAQGSVFTLVAGGWQGSAFVISSDDTSSRLVTNFHVVRSLWTKGLRAVVIRNGDASFNGSIVDVRPEVDLAFVEVPGSLPALEAASGSPDVGEPIVVLGSPFGYGGSVSTGVVSALRTRYVQFSAPISPGSSGGPVLDADGHVIGVAAAKVEGRGAEGLSFAVPIWRVCQAGAC